MTGSTLSHSGNNFDFSDLGYHTGQQRPLGLARHYELSAAPVSGDCDIGSDPRCFEPSYDGFAWEWLPSQDDFPVCSNMQRIGWLPAQKSVPWGEAINPGPQLNIMFANPTGLRGKEHILYNGDRGIHNLVETHLSSVGLKSVCQTLRAWSLEDQRQLRLLPGPAVPLRARSHTTGIWAGTWQSADMPCSRVNLQWPQAEGASGRAQASTFQFGDSTVLGIAFYAWAPGPTWPKARQATRRTLKFLTEEIIHGSSGFRYIAGDLNGEEEHYPELLEWQQMGWMEVQTLNLQKHNEPRCFTCKGVSSPDKIYISPELVQHFTGCKVQDLYADHSSITCSFELPWTASPWTWWPRASKIPWHAVDFDAWKSQDLMVEHFDSARHDPSQFFHQLGRQYEDSFSGYLDMELNQGLPNTCRGRGQIYEPKTRSSQAPKLKSSRQGEEKTSSDLICRSLQRWFKQLRRLQSLLHNLRRGSLDPTAVAYRLETWAAIKAARGFHGSFCSWWACRPVQTHGLGLLPDTLPSTQLLEAIFEDFKANYRAAESWNLRHRAATLKAATQECSRKAFLQLSGDTDHKHIDRFVQVTSSKIATIDPETFTVQLASPLPDLSGAEWDLDRVPAQVQRVDDCTFNIESDLILCPGQELRQSRSVGDTAKMLQMLKDFWAPRWNRDFPPGTQDWTRIMAFAVANLPTLEFPDPEITVEMWDDINLRYTAHSAKGPDSFDHLDLQKMPYQLKSVLISLLNGIENGADWPVQLCQGFGISLPKHTLAQEVGEFRPIVILSTIYRSWSSLRSRACLQTLSRIAAPGVKGFLPGRECGEIWHLVQALAETCLLLGAPLAGAITDIKKAFENVPRRPLMDLARHVGISSKIVSPWERFLTSMQRRFMLHQQVGEPISSNHGLPEGDGLSVLGMTLIDIAWDHYQQKFAPSTLPISFVDNYELLATSCASLMTGFVVLEEFMQLWHLELDTRKTTFWSTDPAERTAMRRLGKPVSLHTADLGGALTFSKRRGMGAQQDRISALDHLWTRLRRAEMLPQIKEMLLRQSFWSKAFYATGITLVPWKCIQQLRTRAVRALGHGHAGAHSGIRLALLSASRSTDPGFFQLLRTLQDFRRFLVKDPEILPLWSCFMSHWNGAMLSGPFCKLIDQFELIGWTLRDPPWFDDHDGCTHNLLTMSSTLLADLLDDAWIQRLAKEVSHRTDFHGLAGIQWPASRHENRLTLLELSRVNALREGAFLCGSAHGKYDLVKGSLCKICGNEDTFEHRVLVCPGYADQRALHHEAVALWHEQPRSLVERLLPNRLATMKDWKHALMSLPERFDSYALQPNGAVHYDLFTDGSAVHPTVPCIALAAWAVVSATHPGVLSSGVLHGIQQSVSRAELTAAISACRWLLEFGVSGTIWTDSAYVGKGMKLILDTRTLPEFDCNEDLWMLLAEVLLAMEPGQTQVQHVASHRHPREQQDPFSEWTAQWNEQADAAAEQAHHLRPASLKALAFQHQQGFFACERHVDLLRAMHLDFAEQAQEYNMFQDEDAENELELEAVWLHSSRQPMEGGDWVDDLPLGWLSTWVSSDEAARYEASYVHDVMSWFQSEREGAVDSFPVSWLELAAMMAICQISLPAKACTAGKTIWVSHESQPAHLYRLPTVASTVRFLREFIRDFHRVFQLGVVFIDGLDLASFRVHPPQQGIIGCFSPGTWQQAGLLLKAFTTNRPVRTANDLARPF